MAWWRKGNGSDSDSINLFSDKRVRENRLRQSVTSIDDLDHLMVQRSARRQSIISMMNEEAVDTSDRSIGSKLFKISRKQEELQKDSDSQTASTADESHLSERSSSDSTMNASLSSSSSLQTGGGSTLEQIQETAPVSPPTESAWYNRLNALSRWEHRQERSYHDTLDERQKLKTRDLHQHQRTQNNQRKIGRNWFGREKSMRDGLDFSRNVDMLRREESVHALADSFTDLSAIMDHKDNDGSNNTGNRDNGYLQDTRPATNPKTQKCVMDLIA